MATIFISHSRRDRNVAELVADRLDQAGHKPFVDTLDLAAGEDWQQRIGSMLKSADVVIVLWSRASVESSICQHEASVGLTDRKLVPIVIDDVDIPLGFHSIQHIKLQGWHGDAYDPRWQSLLEAIKSRKLSQPAPPARRASENARSESSWEPIRAARGVNIFIAHASNDKQRLGGIVEALDKTGFRLWIDKPHLVSCCDNTKRRMSRIHMGDDWKESIRVAVARANKVIAFWSDDAIDAKREQFQYEVYQALVQRKLFQCKLDPMPQDKIGTPYTFHQIADLSDFKNGQYHYELDYVMKDIIKATKRSFTSWFS